MQPVRPVAKGEPVNERTRREAEQQTPMCVRDRGGMPGDPCWCGVCGEDQMDEYQDEIERRVRPDGPDHGDSGLIGQGGY